MKFFEKIRKFLCFIGIHNWNQTYFPVDNFTATVNPPERTCDWCHKKQKLDVHCLGLNPPEFIKTWYDI